MNKNQNYYPRVLAITNMYPSDDDPGDSPCIKDQIEGLRKSGCSVDVMIINRRKKANYIKAAWQVFWGSFKKQDYDIIHGFYGHCGFIAIMQFRLPVVITFRGSDILTFKDGLIGQFAALFAKKNIVMSHEMQKKVIRKGALIIPFGVDLDKFHPMDLEECRTELGLDKEKNYILFPYDPQRAVKRIDIIKKVMENLVIKGFEVELLVVHDQPPDIIAKYMNASDLLIIASDHEGSPMAVREAMACNLPVVSVDVGDVRNLLDGVRNSYICEQSIEDLIEKAEMVLITKSRSDGNRKIQDYSNMKVSEMVIEVYRSILD